MALTSQVESGPTVHLSYDGGWRGVQARDERPKKAQP
jgi:hypothetical protein